jgi:CheY-like chemotaxis protein/HPt (histidine-containing phosphotransfer) domain-containing protein
MPGKDGFHLAEDIRLDPDLRDLPLVILTSSSQAGDRKRANRLRVNGFLNKPVSRRDLLDIAASVLGDTEGAEETPTQFLDRSVAESSASPGGGALTGSEEETTRGAAAAGPAGSPSSGVHVLVAEDNKVNQQVAMGLLRQWGHEVTLAGSGREVLELLEESIPDLILMDVQMPELDGIEATGRIRKDPRFAHLPIVALTAHVLPEERDRCKKAGMDGYLPKPFKPADLKEEVARWAQVSRNRRDSEEQAAAPPPPEHDPAPIDPAPDDPAPHPQGDQPKGTEGAPAPVLIEEFIAVMREAGIESVVEPAIEAYVEETPRRMRALEEAVEREDWAGVESEAHGMKSGSRNIRADTLGDLLEIVEIAGSEGRGTEVRENLPLVREAFQEVMRFFEERGSSS